jgi:hypothetical protein
MFGPSTYHKIAIDLIVRILTQGKTLTSKTGLVMSQKNTNNELIGFGAYKGDDNTMMVALYEGIDATKAADAYVKLVGPINAIGDSVKFFRAQNATITIAEEKV